MTGRIHPCVLIVAIACIQGPCAALAQDVSGIEICTAEKTMERRTSCLQSNINFLQKTITKLGLDSRRQIDAASRRIEALEGTIAELKKTVAERQKKQTQPPAKETEKDKAQESGK